MSKQSAAAAIVNRASKRRSFWMTGLFSIFVATALALTFSQRTYCANARYDRHGRYDVVAGPRCRINALPPQPIVPTGGIEQNGPHMVLGKHDYIVRQAADRIAHELGHTLVTPVVSFVPEGDYDPPSGNMLFPGTLGVPQ